MDTTQTAAHTKLTLDAAEVRAGDHLPREGRPDHRVAEVTYSDTRVMLRVETVAGLHVQTESHPHGAAVTVLRPTMRRCAVCGNHSTTVYMGVCAVCEGE